jgi:hypothetical protein
VIGYSWTVLSAPPGSTASITNASGTVSMSEAFEYHYPAGADARFTPDVAGIYQLELSADLAGTMSTAMLELDADLADCHCTP